MTQKKLMSHLKKRLNYHYRYFDKSQISPDPLEFLHLYKDGKDIEAIGIISSVFAYGRVEQIISVLTRLNDLMEHKPYDFIVNYRYEEDASVFNGIKHRFYTSEDIALLFHILHRAYTSYDSLKELFLLYYFEKENNLKESVSFFARNLLNLSGLKGSNITPGLRFMFPDPMLGSACKRMNLFLRWMVRQDELDFGLWCEIPKNKLVIPVDTHVARICRELHLTHRKNVSWQMAEEITENLKTFDSYDPVKYDFAICHIGMRRMDF
ncbi:MAG TPA: TIGR02757 family protein [Ignavibacteriales bacterium]|nr:TIGR02757 family protein [Ignavibacteriales bacterium]